MVRIFISFLFICAAAVFPAVAEVDGEGAGGQEDEDDGLRFSAYADAGAFAGIVSNQLHVRGGLGISLGKGLMLDLPITAVMSSPLNGGDPYVLLDFGAVIKFYPGDRRFWGSLSLFQGAGFVGDSAPEQEYHYMTELSFGYTYEIASGMYIEPAFVIRDPLTSFSDSLQYIQEYIPGYSDYRFLLLIGWKSPVLMSL